MKIKNLKFIIPCILSLGCLAGCNNGPTDEEENDFSKDTYVGTYYDDYNLKLKGNKLQIELQKLCFNTHSVYVKYKDYSGYASFTTNHISSEAAPSTVVRNEDNSIDIVKSKSYGRNEYFYTGKVSTGVGTREHVWPCANSANLWVHDKGAGSHYVDGTNYKGGGSDLYHVRPSTSSVNTARGNSKFCDFDDPELVDFKENLLEVGDTGAYKLLLQGCEYNDETRQYEYAQRAEPADEYKGDIARILVYVWIHYAYRGNYYGHEDMVGRLDLTNVMAYSGQARVYQKLIEWNEMDPPSETEKLRNDTVQGIQGNRNPFVDHPSLLKKVLK